MSEETEVKGTADGGDSNVPASTWFDVLPDEMKNDEGLAIWRDKQPVDVLKGYTIAQEKLARAIIPPGENSTDEEKQAYEAAMRKALNVPEKVEDYKLELPPEVPKDDPVVAAIIQQGHKDGLNNVQAQGVLAAGIKAIVEHREAQKVVNQEAIKTLWAEKYDENLALAIKGMEGSGKDAGLEAEDLDFIAKALPSSPQLVRIFKEIGKYYSEDKLPPVARGGIDKMPTTAGGTPKLRFPSMEKRGG